MLLLPNAADHGDKGGEISTAQRLIEECESSTTRPKAATVEHLWSAGRMRPHRQAASATRSRVYNRRGIIDWAVAGPAAIRALDFTRRRRRHMNHAKRALLGAIVLGLTGCAARVMRTGDTPGTQVAVPAQSKARMVLNVGGAPQAVRSPDWEAFRGEWRSAFQAQADAAGVAFVWQDGPVKPLGQAGTLLAVQVLDYRYLSSGARYGLGVMTGNAYVNAQLRFLSLADGRPFGEQNVNTSSSAWEGIFSAMTSKQIEAIARDVMRDFRRE
jgi:hypothetical protein